MAIQEDLHLAIDIPLEWKMSLCSVATVGYRLLRNDNFSLSFYSLLYLLTTCHSPATLGRLLVVIPSIER